MNYVYILKCSDDSLYTGWTNNLEKRFNYEEFEDKIDAMKREYEIKQLKRKEKLELINRKIDV